ncbi:MAG TPA: lysophospholipid acyltransferase family protein [Chitinivibrionales bacterium]
MNITVKRLKNDGIYVCVRCLLFVHGLLPRWFGLLLFEIVGAAAFYLPSRQRTLTIHHLRKVFGNRWTHGRLIACARKVYADLGKNAFDAVYFSRLNAVDLDRFIECDDLSAFRRAYEKGKGIVAITAHCGCFEMLLHYFAAQEFACFAIGSRLYDARLDALVETLRSGPNISYLHRSDNMRAMMKLLKEGRVMGALIDQDTKVDGVFAHFLGRLAYTPSGAVRLARRYDIPVFVVTTARLPDNRHRIFISGEIALRTTGDETEDCVKAIECINGHISATIERFPSQWVWMHRRWNRSPENEETTAIPNIERYTRGEQ